MCVFEEEDPKKKRVKSPTQDIWASSEQSWAAAVITPGNWTVGGSGTEERRLGAYTEVKSSRTLSLWVSCES